MLSEVVKVVKGTEETRVLRLPSENDPLAYGTRRYEGVELLTVVEGAGELVGAVDGSDNVAVVENELQEGVR